MKMIETTSIPNLYARTALGRAIDPRFRSNVLAVTVTVATAAVFGLYNYFAADALASTWLTAAGAVFLSWAIGRELDPDRNASAYVAMAVAFVYAIFAPASLLLATGVLLATRMISGTAGPGLQRLDVLAVIGLAALLGTSAVGAAALPGLAAGVVVIGRDSTQSRALGLATVVAGIAAAWLVAPVYQPSATMGGSLLLLAVVTIALVSSIPAPRPQSTTDIGAAPLSARRLTGSRFAAAAIVGLAFALTGPIGVAASFGTAGAAICGVAVAGLLSTPESE